MPQCANIADKQQHRSAICGNYIGRLKAHRSDGLFQAA
jgi:hypothetical protein